MAKRLAALLQSKESFAKENTPSPQVSEEPIVKESSAQQETATRINDFSPPKSLELLDQKIDLVDLNRKIDKMETEERIKTVEKIVERIVVEKTITPPVIQTPGDFSSIPSTANQTVETNRIIPNENKLPEALNSILNFLKKSSEEDRFFREKQKNFEIEQKEEQERKDKEFLDALSELKTKKAMNIADYMKAGGKGFGESADGGLFGFLGKFLKGITELFSGLKTLVTTVGKLAVTLGSFLLKLPKMFVGAISKLFGGIKGILSLLPRIATFFLSPFGLAFLGVTAAAGLIALLASDKNAAETTKGMLAAATPDTAAAQAIMATTEQTSENAIERKKQNLLAERPSNKKSLLFWKDSKLQKEYLQEIGWDEKTGTTKSERAAGAERIDDAGKLVYKKVEPATESTAGGGRGTMAGPTAQEMAQAPAPTTPATPPTPSSPAEPSVPATTAVPTPVDDLGTRMRSVIEDNNELKLFEDVGQTIANSIQNVSMISKGTVESRTGPLPAVRNLEDTFQRMIYNNTRLV